MPGASGYITDLVTPENVAMDYSEEIIELIKAGKTEAGDFEAIGQKVLHGRQPIMRCINAARGALNGHLKDAVEPKAKAEAKASADADHH